MNIAKKISYEYCKNFKNNFFEEHLEWLLLLDENIYFLALLLLIHV